MRIEIHCAFRKIVSFKNGYGAVVKFYGKTAQVTINDITKDSPKVISMTREEFKNTFIINRLEIGRVMYPFEKGKVNNWFYVRFWINNKICLPILKTMLWLRLA